MNRLSAWLERIKQHGVPEGLKVVGSGPFPLPGEARMHRKAQAHADRMMAARRAARGRWRTNAETEAVGKPDEL